MRSLQITSLLTYIYSSLHHLIVKKNKVSFLETILYFAVLLFLPTQLGKHFWPDYSLILGQRIDYLSPTLYITDILIICLFLLRFLKIIFFHIHHLRNYSKSRGSTFFSRNSSHIVIALLITIFFLLNIFLSQSVQESIYGFLKLLEVLFLTYYTDNILRTYPKIFFFPLTFGIFSESILAIIQFFVHGSLGGMLYYLGERAFTSVTPGIANASINGELILRPYGTFSHPNVLAGYLVICMTIIIMLIGNNTLGVTKYFIWLTIFIGSVGLLFTLSRVAILVWFFASMFLFFQFLQKRNVTKKVLLAANGLLAIVVIILFVVSPLLPRFSQLTLQDESVVLREQLALDSFKMLFGHPLLGVGMHAFLPALPHYDFDRGSVFSLQPVHNIFLLISAEAGFPGLWLSVSFVIWLYIRLIKIYLLPLGSGLKRFYTLGFLLITELLILGSFDHYFLTIQQGQLLLALIIGVTLSAIHQHKNTDSHYK